MKVVINRCWGGFGLSQKALHALYHQKCDSIRRKTEEDARSECPDIFDSLAKMSYGPLIGGYVYFGGGDMDRDDPALVRVIEDMGKAADGLFAELKIVVIPNDLSWSIDDYDGMETVKEAHRSWK